MRIGLEQGVRRHLMLDPRRFFGSVCAGFPVVYESKITSMISRLKAYKFRFYPTAQQRHQLAVEFGNARFV